MILYIAIAVALIINIINPRILWRIDSWKYKNASKAEPSPLYLFLCRGLSLLGVVILIMAVYFRPMNLTDCGSGVNSSDKEVPKNLSGDTSAEDADTDAGQNEEFDASALTENEVKSLTTAELVDAILRDPEMTVFSAYNDSMQALEMFRQTYNVYGELNNRDDVLEALADAYDEVKILTAEEMKENEEKGIDDSSEFFLGTNVEILIASELFEIPGNALTDSQRRLCDRIMERSRKVQEIRDQQGDIYNMYSNGFYEFYIKLVGSEYQETMEKSALMLFVPEEE